ncbi:MAG: NADH-flavin oxidoreductase [Paenibacillaceae bacterium]|jgi:2,4-dienoyl-CoA reductase-like NADH-dependent reductase (Old Yellow Enzyme family)|nr:NADH-flavin oxidoreductase [Paenibacillaceae bacterium]
MEFGPFRFHDADELSREIRSMNLNIPMAADTEALKRKPKVGGRELPNSMAVHPMEGCDGNRDGSPGELTVRRYKRFAAGGAGLLWFEAVAVVPEGRANPQHLWIHQDNAESFRQVAEDIQEAAQTSMGKEHNPLLIMQLTHAGRFSRPVDKPHPIIACHNPYLNQRMMLPDSYPVITDSELERLEDDYVAAAKLARAAGFHGVDVKCCHRYLASELLSAYERKGSYGGDFDGRTRFVRNIVGKIRAELGNDFIIATRMNLYDGIPFPHGWGVDREDYRKPDLTEPLRLLALLEHAGVSMVNVTMGTPYYNPHVNRPYDKGGYTPDESQLAGVERLLGGAAAVQRSLPNLAVVGTGYSWLRHLAPYAGAGVIESGGATIIGLGRSAFAYPDFAKDIIETGRMKKEKSCTACSKCTELMRAHSVTGCVVRDQKTYAPLYREFCLNK